MPAELLLLPSPLLPAATYAPLARALNDRGCACRIPSLTAAKNPHQVIEQWSQQTSSTSSFVAHSNAGYLAPIVRAEARSSNPIVFMDAALPSASGETPLAPANLRRFLTTLADDTGLLPPWTRWWPGEDLARTIPSEWVDTIDAACPRLPSTYFDSAIEAPDGWIDGANGYLAFGSTYANELETAQRYDWPTTTLSGGHLAFLWDPDPVADAVLEVLTSMG